MYALFLYCILSHLLVNKKPEEFLPGYLNSPFYFIFGHADGSSVTSEIYTLVKNNQAKTAVSAELERLIKLKDYDD